MSGLGIARMGIKTEKSKNIPSRTVFPAARYHYRIPRQVNIAGIPFADDEGVGFVACNAALWDSVSSPS